jgi:hypothetical protein
MRVNGRIRPSFVNWRYGPTNNIVKNEFVVPYKVIHANPTFAISFKAGFSSSTQIMAAQT